MKFLLLAPLAAVLACLIIALAPFILLYFMYDRTLNSIDCIFKKKRKKKGEASPFNKEAWLNSLPGTVKEKGRKKIFLP